MKALHKYLKTTHVNSLYFKLVVTPNSSSNLKTTHVNTLFNNDTFDKVFRGLFKNNPC